MHWMKSFTEPSQSLKAAGSQSVISFCALKGLDPWAPPRHPDNSPQSSLDAFIRLTNTLARARLTSPMGGFV